MSKVRKYQRSDGSWVSEHERKQPQSGPRLGVDPETAVAAASSELASLHEMSDEAFSSYQQSAPEPIKSTIEKEIKRNAHKKMRDSNPKRKREARQDARNLRKDLKYVKYLRRKGINMSLSDAAIVRKSPHLAQLAVNGRPLKIHKGTSPKPPQPGVRRGVDYDTAMAAIASSQLPVESGQLHERTPPKPPSSSNTSTSVE